MHAKHGVVGLNARARDLRARPHREGDLRLLAVVDGEALEEQAPETRPSATAARLRMCESLFFARWTDSEPYEGRKDGW